VLFLNMHQVIEHILARRNKKVLGGDGRKIALVLFGGGMRGVRGAGALMALQDLGLTHAFDDIYTYSASFPIASYFLSEQLSEHANLYFRELAGHRFINFARFWKVFDIEYIIDVFIKQRPLDIKKILAAETRLHLRTVNISKKSVEYLEVHDFEPSEYPELVKAAMSVPFLHPGSARLRGQRYMDTAIYQDDLEKYIKRAVNTNATDILCIYNEQRQAKINLGEAKRIFEVKPKPEWKLKRIETRSQVLQQAGQAMGDYVKQIFGSSEPIKLL
jgi:predicted patatin/cPLA2 family phospholipase